MKLLCSASPILAAMNTIKQIKYAGRRPVESENVAIIVGEIACMTYR